MLVCILAYQHATSQSLIREGEYTTLPFFTLDLDDHRTEAAWYGSGRIASTIKARGSGGPRSRKRLRYHIWQTKFNRPHRKRQVIWERLDMEAKQFATTFNPNLEKYLHFRGGWLTVKKKLQIQLIGKGLMGEAGYGFFLSKMTPFFALDIDDHREKGRAWYGNHRASKYLMRKYERLSERLPEPSLTIQSPHGLHCYWFLEEWIVFLVW